MAAIATKTEFVVPEDVAEHVQCGVRKHLRQPQRRGVPVTSLTLVDRIMMEFGDLFPDHDQFWERIAAWYMLAMERTEPKCRGFVAADFFEIVATHIRNEPQWAAVVNRCATDAIEARVRQDAYMACTASIVDYTVDDDVIVSHSTYNPQHTEW